MAEALKVTPVLTAQSQAFVRDLGIHGTFTLTFSLPGVTSNSVVMVSMAELDGGNQPFIGDATMTVHNVAPGHESVRVRGEVDWDSDLPVRISFLVA